jgi:hypothetical protein
MQLSYRFPLLLHRYINFSTKAANLDFKLHYVFLYLV